MAPSVASLAVQAALSLYAAIPEAETDKRDAVRQPGAPGQERDDRRGRDQQDEQFDDVDRRFTGLGGVRRDGERQERRARLDQALSRSDSASGS